MEQIAYEFAREYERSRPEEWHVEHITTPRPSCEGLPRRYAPAPENVPCGHFSSDLYANIYYMNTSWGFTFVHQRQRYERKGYETEYAAALAHDALVKAEGLTRTLLFPDAGADMEQSA